MGNLHRNYPDPNKTRTARTIVSRPPGTRIPWSSRNQITWTTGTGIPRTSGPAYPLQLQGLALTLIPTLQRSPARIRQSVAASFLIEMSLVGPDNPCRTQIPSCEPACSPHVRTGIKPNQKTDFQRYLPSKDRPSTDDLFVFWWQRTCEVFGRECSAGDCWWYWERRFVVKFCPLYPDPLIRGALIGYLKLQEWPCKKLKDHVSIT